MKREEERLEEIFKEDGMVAVYVYGPEGVGKRRRIMDFLKNMGFEPVEVPLISSYTALGNFLKAVWDRIPPEDRSMYMGMLRGAVGRFFAHYVPTLAPEIEKMGIDLSRSIVDAQLIFPHIATILEGIADDIVWVLNDYFPLEAADLRKLVNIVYKASKEERVKHHWSSIRIVFISEVDDSKVEFPRISMGSLSEGEFERVIGHRVSDAVYMLCDGNPGVYRVLTKLADVGGKDIRMYSDVRRLIEDILTERQRALYTSLVFVSFYHVGRFGPAMLLWAQNILGGDFKEEFEFLESVGLVEKLSYLTDVVGIPVWRVQYTIARQWFMGVSYEEKQRLLNMAVCGLHGRSIKDGYFILSMHARNLGQMRRAHAYFIRWIKFLQEKFYLQRVLEVLTDLGYVDRPDMLPEPAAAYIAMFLYRYFGSHPSLKRFSQYIKDYVYKRPLVLSMFVEFTLLYGDVSEKEVSKMIETLKDMLEHHRGWPVSVWIMWGIGRIYEELNSYETAEIYYQDALSISNIFHISDSLRLELINAIGRVMYLRGRKKEAREQWVKLLEEARAIGDPIFMSKAYNNLAVYEGEHSFRYSLELFRLSYEIAMGAGTTSAAVSLSNYLSGAYEIITEDSYMERLAEAHAYISSIDVPFYSLLFYAQTYTPLIEYRNSSLVKEWNRKLAAIFSDEGKRTVYAERYVEVLASMALGKALIEGNVKGAVEILKRAEEFAGRYLSSAGTYVSTVYEAYMEIGIQYLDKELFTHGYEGMRSLKGDIRKEYTAVKMYFDGLKSHAIKALSEARRHRLREGRKFTAGKISLYIAEIYYRDGYIKEALVHYRRALSEFEGMGAFQMISRVMKILEDRHIEDALFAGVNELTVERSIKDGTLSQLWKVFETVLEDVEGEIFVYESVLGAYQRIMGKSSVSEIAMQLASSIRFFVSAPVSVSIYREDGKIAYGMFTTFPGRFFIPKVREYSLLSSGISGWYADNGYVVYMESKNDYTILVYIEKEHVDDTDTLFVESIVGLVLSSLPLIAERQHAIVDTLTGLYVRWYILRRLDEEFQRSRREHTPIGVLYMDIDNFKQVNDTFGHAEGDRVLRTVASIIKHSCGTLDIPGRYGGEEFIVIVPGGTLEYAMELAESIRKNVEKEFKDSMYNVTISIGVATVPPLDARSGVELLDMADKAMYWAKRHGKNRVAFATQQVLREVKEGV